MDALDVHQPPFGLQQRRDAPITVAAILLGQAYDRFSQRAFVVAASRRLALGGTVLADHAARPAHADAELLHHVVDATPAT